MAPQPPSFLSFLPSLRAELTKLPKGQNEQTQTKPRLSNRFDRRRDNVFLLYCLQGFSQASMVEFQGGRGSQKEGQEDQGDVEGLGGTPWGFWGSLALLGALVGAKW